MFKTVKRIIDWCGEFKGKLYLGFIFSFFSYWFAAMPVMVAAYTIGMLLDAGRGAGTFDRAWIWKSLVIMGVFVFLRFLFDYLRARCQEAISYERKNFGSDGEKQQNRHQRSGDSFRRE